VKKAIDRCDAVVVLLSDHGANAPFVHQEIGYALRAEKLVIPLVGPRFRARS
jgi:nucleoside 2-deoxyribosyltransferase